MCCVRDIEHERIDPAGHSSAPCIFERPLSSPRRPPFGACLDPSSGGPASSVLCTSFFVRQYWYTLYRMRFSVPLLMRDASGHGISARASWLHRARIWREIIDVVANSSGAAGHYATNVPCCCASCTSVCANQSSETNPDIAMVTCSLNPCQFLPMLKEIHGISTAEIALAPVHLLYIQLCWKALPRGAAASSPTQYTSTGHTTNSNAALDKFAIPKQASKYQDYGGLETK